MCTMKNVPKILVAVVLLSGSSSALAGEAARLAGEVGNLATGQVVITLGLPAVLPTLVVVQPGVTRRDSGWYRTHDHNGHWARIDERQVPVVIARSPPGRYKHDKGDGKGSGDGKSTTRRCGAPG
jgi:uncharacterized protein YdbL (DUF1318 family)